MKSWALTLPAWIARSLTLRRFGGRFDGKNMCNVKTAIRLELREASFKSWKFRVLWSFARFWGSNGNLGFCTPLIWPQQFDVKYPGMRNHMVPFPCGSPIAPPLQPQIVVLVEGFEPITAACTQGRQSYSHAAEDRKGMSQGAGVVWVQFLLVLLQGWLPSCSGSSTKQHGKKDANSENNKLVDREGVSKPYPMDWKKV